MRSVSIVYKKHQRDDSSLHELPHTRALIKRSVDQYYTRLLERERNKEEAARDKETAERVKLKTSTSNRHADQFNILQTLSIAQISLRQPQPQPEREEPRGKAITTLAEKKLEGRTVLRGLQLPIPSLHFQDEEKEQKNSSYKLKNIYRGSKLEGKDTIIVLTANFITDEHYFWEEEAVEEQCLKFWRLLQSYASIVWVCQREPTLKKLLKFAKNYNLRIDAVYLILPRKDRKLTFSCIPIENDFGVKFLRSNTPLIGKDERKMVVVSGIVMDRGQGLNWQGLTAAVPLIRNCRSVVHFVRIDMAEKARLNAVVRVLSQHTPPSPLNIGKIMQEFERAQVQGKMQDDCNCKVKLPKSESVPVLTRIEEIKSKMMKYFTQSLSVNLNDRITYDDTENSIQFLIGDILRRNYKIFQNAQEYSEKYEQYAAHRKLHPQSKSASSPTHVRKYRNMAYLWDV